MFYPHTPLEQVTEWKSAIEEIGVQFEEMEEDENKVKEATTQFLG